MESENKLGMITAIIITPFLFFLILSDIEITISNNLNGIMVLISLSSAISIPYVYTVFQRYRKMNIIKEIWNEKIRLIENEDETELKEFIREFTDINDYVKEVYSAWDYLEYTQRIRYIKQITRNERIDQKIVFRYIVETLKEFSKKRINLFAIN